MPLRTGYFKHVLATERAGPVRSGRMRGLWRVLLAAGIANVAGGCAWLPVILADPGTSSSALQIVAPANDSQLPANGIVDVDVRVGSIQAGSLGIELYTGTTFSSATDLTGRIVMRAGRATVRLTSADLRPGLQEIRAFATTASGAVAVTSIASWEPTVNPASGCEVLGQRRCLLPFPSDGFTVADPTTDTGRRVAFQTQAMPVNVGGVRVDPSAWNRNDGFSPGAPIVVYVPNLDPARSGIAPVTDIGASLAPNAPIVLLDATTGRRVPYFAELDAWATSAATRALVIRQAVNFGEGHRIVVGLRNLRDSAGAPIPPSREFVLFRDNIPTFLPTFEQRRGAMNAALAALDAAGVDRSTLYLAWDFTVASTRNLSERVLTMRDDAFASLNGGAPQFSVTNVQDNVSSSIWRRVRGTFTVPSYLTGDGSPGNTLNYGPNGLPQRNGTIQANFVCNVPRAVSQSGRDPVTPGTGLVYGHGLLGSASEVNSFGTLADTYRYVMCATDEIGMSSADVPNVAAILADLSKFPSLPDRLQQAMVNTMFLARLEKDPRGFESNAAFQAGTTRTGVFNGTVVYNGNSQGGIFGGAVTAVSTEWTRAVLGVPGQSYANLLTRSVDWVPFSAVEFGAYPDELDHTIGYSFIQMLWDRGEADGYAQHLTTDPLPNTPAHTVMLVEAFGDHQVANVATEIEARTIGARVWSPAIAPGRSTDVTPMWGITPLTASQLPYRGSVLVLWDYGTPAPPTTNLPPSGAQYGTDPHGLGALEPRVGQQVAAFLNGSFVDVCNGGPCQSNAGG